VLSRLRHWFRARWEARKGAAPSERHVVVRTDAEGISATFPDGTRQTVRWDEVESIVIRTNDAGPWGTDVWWMIEGATARCVYPGGATL
jgi:hypothetical protein